MSGAIDNMACLPDYGQFFLMKLSIDLLPFERELLKQCTMCQHHYHNDRLQKLKKEGRGFFEDSYS
jgi:hypothetical protein